MPGEREGWSQERQSAYFEGFRVGEKNIMEAIGASLEIYDNIDDAKGVRYGEIFGTGQHGSYVNVYKMFDKPVLVGAINACERTQESGGGTYYTLDKIIRNNKAGSEEKEFVGSYRSFDIASRVLRNAI